MAPYPRALDDWDVDRTPQPVRPIDPSEAEELFQFFQTFVGWIIIFTILGLTPLILCGLFIRLYTIFVENPWYEISNFFRRSWMTLATTPRRLRMMLTKVAHWVCRVKPERPITPQPQESGFELRPVSWPPLDEMSWPLPDDTSTLPPEDASAPPEWEGSSNYQMSDSGLYTLREGDSTSSTHTVVEQSAPFMVMVHSGNAAAASSTETIMPRAM